MKSSHRQTFDICLVVLTAAAALVIALDINGPLRWLLVTPAVLLVPGAAIVPALELEDIWAFAGMTVVLSMAVGTAAATLIAWIGWWQPQAIAAVIALVSCAGLLYDVRRIRRLTAPDSAADSALSDGHARSAS